MTVPKQPVCFECKPIVKWVQHKLCRESTKANAYCVATRLEPRSIPVSGSCQLTDFKDSMPETVHGTKTARPRHGV